MPELVSILIPAYNAEKWIAETLKSALDQTWEHKEIIIVDDGSRDDTLQIAKRFESKSVKVVTQPNRGASAARNKAMSFAQGNYIQWLDADDLLAPDKISHQLHAADSGLNSRVLLTSAFGTFFFRHQKAKFRPNTLWQDLSALDWILTKFTENVWMNPVVWLVTRKLAESAGPWDERLTLMDDGEYICRVVSKCDRVKFVPQAKCYYRIGNISSLDWQLARNLEPFLLATTLSIDHLLSLEDTEKTRQACLKVLQTCFHVFYPERRELLYKINELANRLGGSLVPPKLKLKYRLIQQLFGWRTAKYVANNCPKAKLFALKSWDRVLFNLSRCVRI